MSTQTNPIAHLTAADLDAIGEELDAIRDRVMADLGEEDAAYIRKVIKAQRHLEAGGRAALLVSLFPPAWLAGTAMLSVAKVLENMEIGHNVMHGQYDWMRDPEIHSTSWEWDSASTAESWKHSHNFIHHTFTNVMGKDRDLGYDVLRIDPEQRWTPYYLGQPVYNLVLAALFQWAVAVHDLEIGDARAGRKPWSKVVDEAKGIVGKARSQFVKDYVTWPLLSGVSAPTTVAANLTANLARNVWAHAIIFCGHFPDGAVTFDYEESDLDDETHGGWYVRQLLGSCNIEGGPLLHLMSGNLSHQIEHHLFPDLPASRYAEIAPQVRDLCERYDLPYTSGPFLRQYAQVWRKVLRLSLPGGGDSTVPAPAKVAGTAPAAAAAAEAALAAA